MTLNAPVFIATRARLIRAQATFGLIFLAGCSALPAPPARAVLYDFGPGPLAPAAPARPAGATSPPALAPLAPLAPLALADIEGGGGAGRADTSSAVLYRLAYADARQLRPYQQARWSLPPAQLVQQALRTHLGTQRAVLRAEDALAAARASDAQDSAAALPAVLRIELEEFSQVFTSPSDSVALVRLRATLSAPAAGGEHLLGQRLFSTQVPAASPDAAGGTRALAEATAQAARELSQWLAQLGH